MKYQLVGRNFLYRFLIIFVPLFVILVPFEFQVLPSTGKLLSSTMGNGMAWLWGNEFPYMGQLESDTSGLYFLFLTVVILSCSTALVWTLLSRNKPISERLQYGITTFCAYYVALQFLNYGFDKLFKTQFYLPEPNTLFTPMGMLSKDILYWSVMGSSYSYTFFGGIMEVIPAVLLLFKRTRRLGAVLAFFVACNILMINVGFDISVKLYATFLFLMSLFVAFPGLKACVALLVLNKKPQLQQFPSLWNNKKQLIFYRSIKTFVVGIILVEVLFGHIINNNFNDDQATRPFLHGAYEVEYLAKTDRVEKIKRLFIHRKGYLITQGLDGTMTDFRLCFDWNEQAFQLESPTGHKDILHLQIQENPWCFMLKGSLKGERVYMKAWPIDLTDLPLLQDDFHFFVDEYLVSQTKVTR